MVQKGTLSSVTKLLWTIISQKTTGWLMGLSQGRLKHITALITGYIHFRKHLLKLGISEEDALCMLNANSPIKVLTFFWIVRYWKLREDVSLEHFNQERMLILVLDKSCWISLKSQRLTCHVSLDWCTGASSTNPFNNFLF